MYSFLTLYPFLSRYPYLTRTPPSPLHIPLTYTYPPSPLHVPFLPCTPSSPDTRTLHVPLPYTHVPQGSPPLGPQCQSTHGESKRCSDSLYLKAFLVYRTDVSTATLFCFVYICILCSLFYNLEFLLLILFPFSSSFFCLLSHLFAGNFLSIPSSLSFPCPLSVLLSFS